MRPLPIAVAVLLPVLVLAPGAAYSQIVDSDSTLSVRIVRDSSYVYSDSEGYVIATGELVNHNLLSAASDIHLRATFYNQYGDIIEAVTGAPILGIVPPAGSSPYMLKSATPNPEIVEASVSILSFDSSPTKQPSLELDVIRVYNHHEISITGSITNSGKAPSQDTVVYVAFYDSFSHPSILDVEEIRIGDMPMDHTAEFHFAGMVHPRAAKIVYFAESDIFGSTMNVIAIPPPASAPGDASISDITIRDDMDRKISSMGVGQNVTVASNVAHTGEGTKQFVYYAQVRHTGDVPYVEFIGSHSGVFYGDGRDDAYVMWTPTTPGIYFIETYLWDNDMAPLAPRGPVSIIIVNPD